MKIWLSYKFRGVDLKKLKFELETLISAFKQKGHSVFSMIETIQNWNPDSMTKAEAVRSQYRLVLKCDLVLCLYTAIEPSEGRGWDAGVFAGMGKPTVMAVSESISIPFTEALFAENPANKFLNIPGVIRFKSLEEIPDLLQL